VKRYLREFDEGKNYRKSRSEKTTSLIISDILFLKPNQGRSKLDSVWDQIWATMKSEILTSFGFSPPFVGLKNLQLYLNRVN
jgi:hypothetical protein